MSGRIPLFCILSGAFVCFHARGAVAGSHSELVPPPRRTVAEFSLKVGGGVQSRQAVYSSPEPRVDVAATGDRKSGPSVSNVGELVFGRRFGNVSMLASLRFGMVRSVDPFDGRTSWTTLVLAGPELVVSAKSGDGPYVSATAGLAKTTNSGLAGRLAVGSRRWRGRYALGFEVALRWLRTYEDADSGEYRYDHASVEASVGVTFR